MVSGLKPSDNPAMPRYTLSINGQSQSVTADADTPLLWVLRDHLNLTGTKFGCGAGQCGACTVQVNGSATRSCQLPVSAIASAKITTIENTDDRLIEVCRAAWLEEDVAQCGYCQAGMLMTTSALLRTTPSPTDAQIDAALTNICRCGTYTRLRAAVRRAATSARNGVDRSNGGNE